MLHTCYSLFTCSFLSGHYPNPTAFISLSKPNHERQILENAQKVIHIWANSTAPFMLSITYTWPVFSLLGIFLLKRISRAVKSSFSRFFLCPCLDSRLHRDQWVKIPSCFAWIHSRIFAVILVYSMPGILFCLMHFWTR